MQTWLPDVVPLISGMATLLLLRWMLSGDRLHWAIDQPNHRSLHTVAVPRTGGLAIMAGVMLGWAIIMPPWLYWLAGATLFLTLLSLVDDVRGLSVRWRFSGHIAAAAIGLWSMHAGLPGAWMVAAAFVMVWITNLYNFMDGSDGLAGGMALFGFGIYATAAWMAGDGDLAPACAVIGASSAAFLVYNFHPARVFMGDAGSIPLGFLAASLGLAGWQRGDWPLWFPLMVFSPFVADASLTLVKRLLRGEKIWQAHRSHYYQRLVQMGWGHRKTALWEYALMLAVGLSALGTIRLSAGWQLAMAAIWLATFAFVAVAIDRQWSRHAHQQSA